MLRVREESRWALKRVGVVCLVGLVASSCGWAHNAAEAKKTYRQTVESWVGEPLEQLLVAWGTPDRVASLGGGTRAYSWRSEVAGSSFEREMFQTKLVIPTQARKGHWVCETVFMITAGRVRNVSFHGNDCIPRKKYPAVKFAVESALQA